jgi:low affinity Fe/Cu permease
MSLSFETVAHATAAQAGKPASFAVALLAIGVWASTGPFMDYSDTWQLIANTGTTLITFAMMFLLQATQTRDTKALQAKLDELIHATEGARDELTRAEERNEAELETLRRRA